MPNRLLIVGATASSKSKVAVDLALQNKNTEIISLDSMQIYKGMDIGTGTLSNSEMNGIKHHMISIVEPTEQFSVQVYKTHVDELIASKPETNIVLVGGTGLYTHAVVDDFIFAPSEQLIRNEIIDRFNLDENNPDDTSVCKAYEYLSRIDPEAAKKIEPNNVRRIIRALEAIEISGEKFSQVGEGVQSFSKNVYNLRMIGLRYNRENLRERIKERIESMFENGWVEEVINLEANWENITPIAKQAIGYKEIYDWNKQGQDPKNYPHLKEIILNKTYQLSVRQRKWFERDPRISWIDCDDLKYEQIFNKVKEISLW